MLSPKLSLVVVQPTPFCNLDCKYCYLPDRSVKSRMQPDTLQKFYEFLFGMPRLLEDRLSINWHAGEPLAVPIQFYQSALAIQEDLRPKGIKVTNRIQTNGTLLTQAWCDFIRLHRVVISVSVDGPQRFHDARRIDRSGRGSFDRTLQGITLLRKNGIPFDLVAVMSLPALDFAEEIFSFFMSLNPRQIGINFEEIVGTNRQSSFHNCSPEDKARRFMETVLKLRDEKAPELRIRDMDNIREAICAWRGPLRHVDSMPRRVISVSWDGKISSFSPELLGLINNHYADFVFGNVSDNSLADIVENKDCRAVRDEVNKGVSRCRTDCQYFCLCGGGSPVNKLCENGTFDSTETIYCRLTVKVLTEVVIKSMEAHFCLRESANSSVLQRIKRLLPLAAREQTHDGTLSERD